MKFCKKFLLPHLLTNFTESEEKKEKNFSSSRNFNFTCIHFNIYECLKRLEKPFWLLNIKFHDITDIYRRISPKVFCKNGALDSFVKFLRKLLCRSLLLKSNRLQAD